MKIYSVYKLDHSDSSVKVLKQYSIESICVAGIQNLATLYIKDLFGQSHLAVCNMIGKTIQQINNDDSIKAGCYLIKSGDKIIVVSKDKYEEFDQISREVITPVRKVVGVADEIEMQIMEKVTKTITKIVTEPISYLASFITSPTTTEITEDIQVDELVTKKIPIYREKEIVIDTVEIVKEYERKKVFKTIPVCEFGMFEIDISDYIFNAQPVTCQGNENLEDRKIITNKIKEDRALYLEELSNRLKQGSFGLKKKTN
jgi:hypothetical protein